MFSISRWPIPRIDLTIPHSVISADFRFLFVICAAALVLAATIWSKWATWRVSKQVALPAFVAQRKALKELRATGGFTQLTEAEMVRARKDVEDLIRLDEYYAIEAETVEHA
jgi:hypothetical protein